MIDLLPTLLSATQSLRKEMADWFTPYPPGVAWNIVSDYCIGDPGKNNDVMSFVVVANHAKTEDICEHIAAVAPHDIKSTKEVPLGLVEYLTCKYPVTFSVTFALKRESALLRNYIRAEDMADFVPFVCSVLTAWRGNSPVDPAYFDQAIKRFEEFGRDVSRKQFNAKLARQVHIAAAFLAVMFLTVTEATNAGFVRWISDRDAIVERYGAVVYDLAFVYFVLMMSSRPGAPGPAQGVQMLDLPKVYFEIPEKAGRHRFDELVRLPDYLAGTVADVDWETLAFSKEKFTNVLHGVFVNEPNNWIVQVDSTETGVMARSVAVVA